MEDFNTQVRDYDVTTNPVSWGLVTGAIFFYDFRSKADGTYPVKIRITFKRKRQYYNSGYCLTKEQWKDFNKGRGELKNIRVAIQKKLEVIGDHVKDMNASGNFSFDLLERRLGRGDKNNVVSAFKARIADLRSRGQVGTAVTYECAMNSLIKHNGNNEILPFARITKNWLEGYENKMIDAKNSYTTISMYLRSLRAIFNTSGIPGPFGKDKYEIPKGGERKLALSLAQINGILMKYSVVPGSTTDKMRDLWYFSFLTNGLNVKDMIGLRWSDIYNNELYFQRAKTIRTKKDNRKSIIAPILPETQKIIDKWGNRDSEYIFGYLKDGLNADEIRIICQNVTRLINKHVGEIAKEIGLPHTSTYTARHSYASNLLRAKASTEFISEQLGHADIRTTQAYLNGFDSDTRREVNALLTNE